MEIDQHDYQIIHYLKRTNQPTAEGLIQIWMNRCGIERRYVQFAFIAERMLMLVEHLELGPKGHPGFFARIVNEAHPDQQWKYGLEAPDDYWGNWARVAANRLRQARVDEIPGYAEYLENLAVGV